MGSKFCVKFQRHLWQTTFSNSISLMKIFLIENLDSNFIEVCSKGLINKSALVQGMAWRRRGNKTFLEPILTKFADAYMRHQGTMS